MTVTWRDVACHLGAVDAVAAGVHVLGVAAEPPVALGLGVRHEVPEARALQHTPGGTHAFQLDGGVRPAQGGASATTII